MSEKPSAKSSLAASFNSFTIAILVGVFILGIGIGTAFSSVPTANQGSISTRYDIDQKAPSPEICLQYGASAITVDIRAYVTFSPFNAFLSQPKMQPGCILRSSNWGVLQSKNLITSQQANECKNRLNTFGFTGNLEGSDASPKIECVYQNDAAGNLFLNGPGTAPPDSQRF
jgi:hypothetical protein